MERKTITRLILAVLLTATFYGCENEGCAGGDPLPNTPVISDISTSDCHNYTDKEATKDMSTDSVVVSWNHDSGQMTVTHYNMALDCGLYGDIPTTIERNGDTITVIEHVGEQGVTDCVCLYDNSFQINYLISNHFVLVIKIESLLFGTPELHTVYE